MTNIVNQLMIGHSTASERSTQLPAMRTPTFEFSTQLRSEISRAPTGPPTDLHDRPAKAREAASQLVSSALILPILDQLRNSPLVDEDNPFSATLGERRFGPLLDQEFADRITTASSFPLIDAIVARYPQISAGTTTNNTLPAAGININVDA